MTKGPSGMTYPSDVCLFHKKSLPFRDNEVVKPTFHVHFTHSTETFQHRKRVPRTFAQFTILVVSPTRPLRLSSATNPWGRGRSWRCSSRCSRQGLSSCFSRQGLSSSRSRCGQWRCCAQPGRGHRNARCSPSPRAKFPPTPRCCSRRPLRRRHRYGTAPAAPPARPSAR